ncbi:MAG TPA: hypothetical protein VIY08_14315 [Candidatus Nitrosocosmicus sp.]
MRVTDERVHDSKVLHELIENMIEHDKKITIGKLMIDVLMRVITYSSI